MPVDSRWTHYAPPQRRRGGATRFTFDRKKLEQKMVLDSNPSCFLLQALALRRRFREATDTLVAAIRRFDFSLYSPLLSNLFGPEIVADEGSGVDALFPKPPDCSNQCVSGFSKATSEQEVVKENRMGYYRGPFSAPTSFYRN